MQLAVEALKRIRLRSPVLFRQQCPSREDEVLQLVKLRTVRNARPDAGPESDDDRTTPFGRRLRSIWLPIAARNSTRTAVGVRR